MTDITANVFEAFTAVMAEVRAIEKGDRNTQAGGGYMFRGIDAVMDRVGPILRTHKVFIIPTAQNLTSEHYESRGGAQMRSVTVKMRYRVYGPGGDYFDGVTYGESADAGDKAVAKAQSVAYRVFLLQGLTVPTGDPDPDLSTNERTSTRPVNTAPPSNPELDDALAELDDTVLALSLTTGQVAAQFYGKHHKPPRDTDAATVRAFIQSLHDSVDPAAVKP